MPNRGVTERRIAEAALALVDQDGVDGLSMRKLAQRVGVAPMSLYTYFPDRDAVLEAVAQLLLAQVEVPDPDLDWRDTVRSIMRSVRAVGLRHRNAAPLVNRFPPRTPDALAFVEAALRAFRRAGIDDATTARCYRALAAYSMGTLDVELGGYFTIHPAAQSDEPSLDVPTPNRHLPHVARIGPRLAEQDDASEFEYGLELLLAGLAAAVGSGR
ncbi:TetR/AcrR family transcriptional regulator [Geodermatophilus sp. SYSU D01180]